MSANPKLFELRMEYPQAFTEITLRDLFAMAALAGYCASDETGRWSREKLAESAYASADAMLKERVKR